MREKKRTGGSVEGTWTVLEVAEKVRWLAGVGKKAKREEMSDNYGGCLGTGGRLSAYEQAEREEMSDDDRIWYVSTIAFVRAFGFEVREKDKRGKNSVGACYGEKDY